MNKRVLGRTGIAVSEIAFGGVEIGIPYGIGVKDKADMLSEKEAVNLLHTALDEGINFFDTARLYGESERIMGNAFNDRRGRVVLCTKCVHLKGQQGKIAAYPELKKQITNSLQESLRALQTDYIDVFMLHQADVEILENEDIGRIITGLKETGVVRATGVSVYVPEETKKAIDVSCWDVIQLPFNLMDQRQEKYFSLAAQKGIAIVVRSVLLKGLLSERGVNLHPELSNISAFIKKYHDLLGPTCTDLPSLATKYALSFEAVSAILVGIDKLDYLYQSLKSANGAALGQETVLKARGLAYPDPDFINLANWSKMGWLE